jgi:hypothetical protein
MPERTKRRMFPLTNDREVGWEVVRERQNTANAVSTQIVSMNRENGALISRGVFVQFPCQDTHQHAKELKWIGMLIPRLKSAKLIEKRAPANSN